MADDKTYLPPNKDTDEIANRSSKTTGDYSGAFSGDIHGSPISIGTHYYGDEKAFKKFQQLTALYNFDLSNVMKVIGQAIDSDSFDNKLLCFGMSIYFFDPVVSCICDRLKLALSLLCGVQIYSNPILLGSEFDKSFQSIILDLKKTCVAEIQEGHLIVKVHVKSEEHVPSLLSEILTMAENDQGHKVIVIMIVDEEIKLPDGIITLPLPDITLFDFSEWAIHHLDKKGWNKVHDVSNLWKELFQIESYTEGIYRLNDVYRHLDWVLDKLLAEISKDEFIQILNKKLELAKTIRSQIYG